MAAGEDRDRTSSLGSAVRRTSVAAFSLIVAGCNAGLGDITELAQAPLRVGDEVVVAEALSGERCRARKVGDDGTRFAMEDFVVVCDGWDEPAARLRRFRLAEGEALSPFLQDPELRTWDHGRADCREKDDTATAAGTPALVRRCVTEEGWPAAAWAVRADIDGRAGAVVGFGLPHVAPVIEALAAGVDAGSVRRAGTRSPMAELAETQRRLEGEPVALAQIMDFRELRALGRSLNQAGQFTEAVLVYQEALGMKRAARGADSPFLAPTYAALALNLASDGRHDEAEAMFARAGDLARAIAWNDVYATYLTYEAVHLREQGELAQARTGVEEALQARLARYPARSVPVAQTRLVLSGVLEAAGALDRARGEAEQALSIFERTRDYPMMSFALGRLAVIERRAGDLDSAGRHATRARRLAFLLFGDGPNLALMERERGVIARAAGDDEGARSAFRIMVRAAEAARRDERHFRSAHFEPFLDLLFDAGDASSLAESWRVVQLARGPVVDRASRRMTARLSSDDPAIRNLAQDLEEVRGRLVEARLERGRRLLDIEAEGLDGDPVTAALAEEIETFEAERRRLERTLQAEFPGYGRLVAPAIVEADAASEVLDEGEGLLKFAIGDDATFVLLLDSTGRLEAHRLELGREALAERVAHLRTGLTFAEGLEPFDLEAAHNLYSDLLAPLEPALDRLDHVVVVAEEPLLSLPLGVLPRRPAVENYREAAWLARDLALTSATSVGSFVAEREAVTPSRAQQAFLGVGDPELGGAGVSRDALARAATACREEGPFDPALLGMLPSLPETAGELERVADLLGRERSRLVLRREAREARLRQLPLADYRVISFATHGLLPGELPCKNEPGLVTTPPAPGAQAERADDGLLDASEIAGLSLDAEIVVLSACNTAGPGGELGGEALSGLASAFLHAGARSLVASHWDVASEPTVILMEGLFAAYDGTGGAALARALQAAQRPLMEAPATAHPAFWGAFTIIGQPSSKALST